jgi:ligand-binding SRPBCC domain-containing protein
LGKLKKSQRFVLATIGSQITALRELTSASRCVQLMTIHTLEQEQRLPISLETAWNFFSSPRNLDEITPSDLGFKIVSLSGDKMYEGQIITYKVMIFPAIWVPWVTEIKAVDEKKSFVDEQRFGPYKFWHHRHTFEEITGGVLMRDQVHYGLGFGPFGAIAHTVFVRSKLQMIFKFRHEMLEKRFGTIDSSLR